MLAGFVVPTQMQCLRTAAGLDAGGYRVNAYTCGAVPCVS